MSIQENKILITINMFGVFSSFAKTGQIKFGLDKPANIEQIIFKLDSSCSSGLYQECIADGKIKDGILILVNGQNAKELKTIIKSDSIVTFITAISGG